MTRSGSTSREELLTERRAEQAADRDLDLRSPAELVALIHAHDRAALAAVGRAEAQIAAVVEATVTGLAAGGRLVYVGAGTSGRLGALDAAECPPTFGVAPERVVACMAGGEGAFFVAMEGAEDSRERGAEAIDALEVGGDDVVCGITASGATPFVLAALDRAHERGATTALITAGDGEAAAQHAELPICLDLGPATIAGSTRMQAGLATKAVLHTLSTAAMIRLGHVYDNLMVDVMPTNAKLVRRARGIVATLTGLDDEAAGALLAAAGDRCKVAVVMHHQQVGPDEAEALLAQHGGHLRPLIAPPPPR